MVSFSCPIGQVTPCCAPLGDHFEAQVPCSSMVNESIRLKIHEGKRRIAFIFEGHSPFFQRAAAAFLASCFTNRLPKYLREFWPPFFRIFCMNLSVSRTCTLPARIPGRAYCAWRGVIWLRSLSTAALSSTIRQRTPNAPRKGPREIAPNLLIWFGPSSFCV